MAQQARKSEGDVFFGQRIGQGRAAFVAAVCGIDHGENAMRWMPSVSDVVAAMREGAVCADSGQLG